MRATVDKNGSKQALCRFIGCKWGSGGIRDDPTGENGGSGGDSDIDIGGALTPMAATEATRQTAETVVRVAMVTVELVIAAFFFRLCKRARAGCCVAVFVRQRYNAALGVCPMERC